MPVRCAGRAMNELSDFWMTIQHFMGGTWSASGCPPASINRLAVQYGVEDVILSIPTLTNRRKQEIISQISGLGAENTDSAPDQ